MSMSAEQEQFFRAELARTPAQFMRMTPSEIETELDRRWAARVPDGMMLMAEKLSNEEERDNNLMYVTALRRNGETQYLYKVNAQPAVDAVPGLKRKRESEAASDAAGSSTGMVHLQCFLMHFKKDTLQDMCEDLSIPYSGNKSDLIARIAERF